MLWHDELGFSNWLHQNIRTLGDEIGLQLVSRQREAPVGRLSADLLAEIEGTDQRVIIENQIYVANHAHFGQVITYAAHYDAYAIIWISSSFRNEYRAAVTWLNGLSRKRFYAVELQVDADVPKFKLVAGPEDAFVELPSTTEISPRAAEATEAGTRGAFIRTPFAVASAKNASPGQLALDAIFERIAEMITYSRVFGSIRKPTGDRCYFAFASGPVLGSEWSIVFTNTEIRLELVFNDGAAAKTHLESVKAHATALEAAVGQIIDFDLNINRKKQKVIVRKTVSYEEREYSEESVARWCVDTITLLAVAIASCSIF